MFFGGQYRWNVPQVPFLFPRVSALHQSCHEDSRKIWTVHESMSARESVPDAPCLVSFGTVCFVFSNNYRDYGRRKFRSQTSDNMDRWKAETERVREKRKVEERWDKSEKRKSQKKEAQMREKVGKSRNTVFFQWFVAPEGRKVGSPDERWKSARHCGAKHISKSKCTKHTILGPLLEVEMLKKCTPLWREAHFQVKMYKAHHSRTTFGSWDVEKVRAVVARSTFWSQNVENTRGSDHFSKSWDVEKVHAVVARSTFRSQNVEGVRTTFGRSDVVSCGRRRGLCTLAKVSKTWGFLESKNHGKRGAFAEDLQRCLFRGRRSTRDIFIRAVWRSGRWFPERDCILEHQIFRFAEMILRDRCSTSYDLASLFRGRRSSLDSWKNPKTHWYEAVSSALKLSIFEGSLAELLRFWCCQVQNLRTSRRIASFSSLQIDR